MDPLVSTVHQALAAEVSDASLGQALGEILQRFDCVVGTIHTMGDDGLLALRAQKGVPPPVLDKIVRIPVGRGMAGLAAERREPVQVCNLQTDSSGDARPGAKLTQMKSSIALPMLDGERVMGVLGVARPDEYEYDADEIALLMELGRTIGQALER